MQATRRMRLQSVIQEEISVQLSREIKDPRIPSLTITGVEVTPDGSMATVSIAILGGTQGGYDGSPALNEESAEKRMKECLKGLASASGLLRRHLARILNIRHCPELSFKEDKGFENTMRVNELLKKISETS